MANLTGRQRAFIEEYFKDPTHNGTRAAERAGYQANTPPEKKDAALAAAASRLLRNVNVAREIGRRWATHGMTSEEVVARLVEQGRANIADFLDELGQIDLQKVRQHGNLVKSITWAKFGPRLELYSAQDALELMGKHFGLFVEKVDVTTGGKPLDKAFETALARAYGHDDGDDADPVGIGD